MYSSIIKKTCACGCGRWPSTGYKGFFMDCRPDLKEEKIKKQAERQKARNSVSRTQSSLRKLMREDEGVREGVKKAQTKSELLREADMLFSLFIKNRDADKNGNICCVCCGKVYNLEQVDKEGKKVVQNLHFIDRDVYSLRFDEDNCHAGCGYCNLDMYLNKNGFAYRRYLEFMNTTYGEDAVAEMALAHRAINKLEITQLKNIIEHYKTTIV